MLISENQTQDLQISELGMGLGFSTYKVQSSLYYGKYSSNISCNQLPDIPISEISSSSGATSE